eukprot:7376430-Ditylum_brightwellii.AAC.1
MEMLCLMPQGSLSPTGMDLKRQVEDHQKFYKAVSNIPRCRDVCGSSFTSFAGMLTVERMMNHFYFHSLNCSWKIKI